MDVKKDILWRVYLCFLCMVLLCVFVLGRAIYIQTVQGKYWIGMSDSLHIKSQPIIAERGTIYSEDGNMLSTSVPVFDIYVDFAADGLREKQGKRFKDHIDSLSFCLSKLFADKSAEDYKKQFGSNLILVIAGEKTDRQEKYLQECIKKAEELGIKCFFIEAKK